jgi:predicted  nucleic acid-binding Zn-ribbon protein
LNEENAKLKEEVKKLTLQN